MQQKSSKKHISLVFDPVIFKIMKQRKNHYAKKHKYTKLSWSEFLKIVTLCSK